MDWSPYILTARPSKIRSLTTREGLCDRLHFIAFAERQAARAFREAPERYPQAPAALKEAWRWVAQEELKHECWLLERFYELGGRHEERSVSLDLYTSFGACESAESFSRYMQEAERRGEVGGKVLAEKLALHDAVTAKILLQIALEEDQHISMVDQYLSTVGNSPNSGPCAL